MRSTILLLSLLLSLQLFAQQPGRLVITIHNTDNTPLEGATVELLRAADSVLVRSAVSDRAGIADLERIPEGTYHARVTMTGFAVTKAGPISITKEQPDVKYGPVVLSVNTTAELGGVTVTAKKPFIQKLTDRLIVNVESSIISAGSSALDVLERSPGVSIDQNDAVSLRGRQGVLIMIDGKPSPLGPADVANYLRGLPASAIDRIEIITNPSAKYDAAGNSGIIDIRMKKDQRLGLNGTYTAGYGQGVFPKANAGSTFNYRNKKVNMFGNYNYNYRKNLNHLLLDRSFFTNGVLTSFDTKDNYMTAPMNSHNARFGADYFPSKKTIIGFVLNGNFAAIDRTNDNVAQVFDQQRAPSFNFLTHATSLDKFDNIVGNANIKHTFDSTGKELTADFDYGVFNNLSLSSTATRYVDNRGSVYLPPYILDGNQDGRLTIKSFKADYVNPLPKGAKLEAGFKTSFVSSDNDVRFFDVSNGTPQNDVQKTNRFFYDENINAGYLNVSKQFKKWSLQVGLRGEETNIKGRQVVNDMRFDSSYFQLFPSAFLTYNVAKDQTLGFSVSRRIDRPGYSQLNPFQFLIDVTLYSTGNTRLLPQFTWSYEMSYTLKQLNFTLAYSRTRQNMTTAILRYNDVFPSNPAADNVTVQIPLNLESSDYVGLNIAAPVRVNSWWNMMTNADLFYIHFNSNIANTPLSNGTPSARLSNNNTMTLGKGWTSELNFNYNSPGRSGYMEFRSSWGLAAGIQKNVMKNKGTVRFNISDIFWTNLPRATITYGNYIENWRAYRETRVANLTFTYRFGNNKVQAARRRITASEDERRRAGN
ncbi:outer membrane beta-barrel protein [Aridibaculum aurantiacum]|uniref:outer membrane beta-barrel protein n=1 Tax=Aridibaculum aurantiacum TaxID=2810307 RepID=UPI001A971F93|nr:outer membrane beta-barrel protein [Aridibaculum aurantiacum]